MAERETELEIWQDGMCVAGVSSADRLAAFSEAAHYTMVYSQDGPVELFEVTHDGCERTMTPVPVAYGTRDKSWETGQDIEPNA